MLRIGVVDDERRLGRGLLRRKIEPLPGDVANGVDATDFILGSSTVAPHGPRNGYREIDLEEHREVPVGTKFAAVQEDPVEQENRIGLRGLERGIKWRVNTVVERGPPELTAPARPQGLQQAL